MTALVEMSAATIRAPGGRSLFEGLSLRLAREHVALVGRNGVGKSTLLGVLAGAIDVDAGRVRTRSVPHFVPQLLLAPNDGIERTPASHGERRRQALKAAQSSGADILLLDEPSEDLDEPALAWLRGWLGAWPGCLVIASHDRRLLADFRHFFVASESGCRHFSGTLAELESELDRADHESRQRYVRNLNRLGAAEAHTEQVARRKARKKRYGRCSELDRATPRARLNEKRSDAQVSQGRASKLREARLTALREWTTSTRRALPVHFPVVLPPPLLPDSTGALITLRGVSAKAGRCLFQSMDLELRRQRLGVVGANGAGKTTLLSILLGRRQPDAGSVAVDLERVGSIAQAGADWMLEDPLLSYLRDQHPAATMEELVTLLAAHQFPLALAERPLESLSPGERARAALICLFRRSPAPELLVLDEPTYSLDLVGQRVMTRALRAWPGGLVVASHDRAFLSELGIERWIELG